MSRNNDKPVPFGQARAKEFGILKSDPLLNVSMGSKSEIEHLGENAAEIGVRAGENGLPRRFGRSWVGPFQIRARDLTTDTKKAAGLRETNAYAS
jgi:hypothetical protein